MMAPAPRLAGIGAGFRVSVDGGGRSRSLAANWSPSGMQSGLLDCLRHRHSSAPFHRFDQLGSPQLATNRVGGWNLAIVLGVLDEPSEGARHLPSAPRMASRLLSRKAVLGAGREAATVGRNDGKTKKLSLREEWQNDERQIWSRFRS